MDYRTSVFDGDPDRQAIILPGAGYTVDMPVLWYAATALSSLGWTCTRVTWPASTEISSLAEAAERMVVPITEELVTMQQAQRPDAQVMIVGKSLGTTAMPVAVERGLPGVWLTPVLKDPRIGALARELDSRHLLVGGTADPHWGRSAADRTQAAVTEIADADHSLQVPDDLDATMDAIGTMARAVGSFAANL